MFQPESRAPSKRRHFWMIYSDNDRVAGPLYVGDKAEKLKQPGKVFGRKEGGTENATGGLGLRPQRVHGTRSHVTLNS
jgi:hypothetical protein